MSKAKQVLDEAGKVYAVMVAAGRSPRLAEFLPPEYRKRLAALHVAGVVVEGVRDKVITILRECGKSNKATIEGLTEGEE